MVGLCLALAVVVLLVFYPTLRHDFVNYDDNEYFFSNPQVQAGLTWPGATWAFRTTHSNNWHPLTWLTLMLDAELFGTGPRGPHLTNLLLHAANSVLLFLLLRRMTAAHWRSAAVAALFALHPLHVESVAWVSERKDVLSAVFFMLTLLMYARFVERSTVEGSVSNSDTSRAVVQSPKSKVFYGLALLFFALGLMSKPMLVTLPFVLLLLDFWPLRRSDVLPLRRLIVEKLPFLAMSLAASVATVVAQHDAVQSLDRLSLGIRAVNAVVAYVRYLGKAFWPVDLAVPYPHPGYGSPWLFGLSAGLMLISVVAVWRFGRKFPFLVTGWFWYVGMLVPTIGLVQVGMQSMADRYTYLPLIGVFIILAWGTNEMLNPLRLSRSGRTVVATCVAVILMACVARTVDQLGYWRNGGTLFRHTLAVTKRNDLAHYNLGQYYSSTGENAAAIEQYLNALEIRPNYDDALNNLGVALAMKGELDAAVARIQEAIRRNPNKADARFNLGNVFVLQRRFEEAAGAYEEALRLQPDYPEAHNNLANVLAMLGRRVPAGQHYREALRLNPSHEGAKRGLRALGEPLP